MDRGGGRVEIGDGDGDGQMEWTRRWGSSDGDGNEHHAFIQCDFIKIIETWRGSTSLRFPQRHSMVLLRYDLCINSYDEIETAMAFVMAMVMVMAMAMGMMMVMTVMAVMLETHDYYMALAFSQYYIHNVECCSSPLTESQGEIESLESTVKLLSIGLIWGQCMNGKG